MLVAVAASLLTLGLAASAGAGDGEQAGPSETRPQAQDEAELRRYLQATGKAPVVEKAPDSCPAVAREGAAAEALQSIEHKLAQARAEQRRRWAEAGWASEKEAAEAGEPVLLNGTGYNYRALPAAPR